MAYDEFLIELLSHCSYEEDVKAAEYWVFHSRYNGCSNQCLACYHYLDPSSEDDNGIEAGHAGNCVYVRAVLRCRGSSLDEWVQSR